MQGLNSALIDAACIQSNAAAAAWGGGKGGGNLVNAFLDVGAADVDGELGDDY